MLTSVGNVDQGGVGHGRSFVLGLTRHEVGNVNLGAEDGERSAFDMTEERVAGGYAKVIVAERALLEVRQRLAPGRSTSWHIAR